MKWVFFVLLISPLVVSAKDNQVPYSKYWEELFVKNDYETLERVISIELSDSKIKRSPAQHITALSYLGKIRLHQKKYKEALEYLLRAKQLNPKNLDRYSVCYNQRFADLFKEIGALNLAIHYYKECYRMETDPFEKYLYLGEMGSCYLRSNDFKRAITIFEEQNEVAKRDLRFISQASSANNLGLAYYKTGQYHEAIKWYLESLSILREHSPSGQEYPSQSEEGFYCLILQNLGISYSELKNYNESIRYLSEAFTNRKTYVLTGPDEVIKGEAVLVLNLLKVGRVDEAGQIVALFEPHFAAMSDEKKLMFLEMKVELALKQHQYGAIEHLLQLRREIVGTVKMSDKIKESALSNLLSQYMMASFTQRLESEKIRREQLKKDKEIQENKTIVLSVLFTISSALLVLLFFVVRQMAKNRQKKQKLEKELQAVEEERMQLKLKDQENSLTNLALELLQKRETSDDLVQKINLLLKKEDQTIKTELISILREAKTNAHRQPDIQYEDSDAVVQLKEFQQRLRKISPTISKSEMELSTYVRMNLSNKEIAAIRNCTENTIKTARHRLKKRLGLSTEESLAKFVMDI